MGFKRGFPMAGPKQKAGTKRSALERPTSRKKTDETSSVQKRADRDVFLGPTSRQIEESLRNGTSITLEHFRKLINWS